jgi:hypothetical protein
MWVLLRMYPIQDRTYLCAVEECSVWETDSAVANVFLANPAWIYMWVPSHVQLKESLPSFFVNTMAEWLGGMIVLILVLRLISDPLSCEPSRAGITNFYTWRNWGLESLRIFA